ncbi:hypothetical protein AB1Y20_009202 [Prymnesium parvum]|uniref:Uncharacterized protein n=1 Tax=Prymnesium parvum TaxID=97485 RepID=A0AB34JZP3_PRYPA
MRARLRSLASWTMLTASTIGPGTVAMCAKAGADTHEKLLWCVLVASTVAWVLQETAGRLTLVSNMSLGECALAKLPCGSYRAAIRWALTLFVVLGGLAYEANNISGTMAAIQVVVSDESALCLINVALGPLCALLLCGGSTQRVSYFLSSVVILMILCFSIAVAGSGLPSSFFRGIIPSIPAGKAELALGLIGTTAIPHNLLLGSVLARGVSLAHMRQGVLLASTLSGLISLLILLVGTRADVRASDFELRDVADVLASVMGPAGIWVFALGLFGAGLSSAMTTRSPPNLVVWLGPQS